MTPAIVVLAYNRPRALRRLLASLRRAHFPAETDVPLVISIDLGHGPAWEAALAIARRFEWPFGTCTVMERTGHLGVVGHFRAAGGLARTYGGVVLLEDDLVVAPGFYAFACGAIDAYDDDPRIAGCCLYALSFNGYTREPFLPIDDGSGAFFLQVPYTQGLCFSARQWADLAPALDCAPARHPRLHPAFERFGPDEWFPALASYMAANDRYFCYPHISLTAGWGDAGAHFSRASSWFQAPLRVGAGTFAFPTFDDAIAVYDGFFELLPAKLASLTAELPLALQGRDFDLDINATKRPGSLTSDVVLTTRPVRRPIARFGLELYPPELNVAWGVPGKAISLARMEEVRWDRWSEIEARRKLHRYSWRRHRRSRRRELGFTLARTIAILRESIVDRATNLVRSISIRRA